MPIAKRQLELAEVDIRVPSEGALAKFIERLSTVERDFLNPEDIEANRERRLAWLSGRDWD
jgi:hypothetical protein